MQRQVAQIEEFNLGREAKFKGDLQETTLYLVHELAEEKLASSADELKTKLGLKAVKTCLLKNLDELLQIDKSQLMIYSTHLSLDKEIVTHQEISSWALKNNIFQLNPYNKIAKIFDDKYLFYVLMVANDILQPYTISLFKKGAYIDGYELDKLYQFPELIIKPRHGTENIDTKKIKLSEFDIEHELISKIRRYDDCLVQEAIDIAKEHKLIYLNGKCFSMLEPSQGLKDIVMEFVDLIDQYASKNEIIMPGIFTMDILEATNNKFYFLEANIRPAAIYRFQFKL
ncbi:MAG: hypothetical protein LW817_07630 [Candidatus Caenarcaniphilales bacterium]|jgi:hypothetical protein|nr:hypothetical protein [Candidatus Caenarcaniphilales bacterium]